MGPGPNPAAMPVSRIDAMPGSNVAWGGAGGLQGRRQNFFRGVEKIDVFYFGECQNRRKILGFWYENICSVQTLKLTEMYACSTGAKK